MNVAPVVPDQAATDILLANADALMAVLVTDEIRVRKLGSKLSADAKPYRVFSFRISVGTIDIDARARFSAIREAMQPKALAELLKPAYRRESPRATEDAARAATNFDSMKKAFPPQR